MNASGILKILRYLWSLPAFRKLVGWLLQLVIGWIIKMLKSKRKKKANQDGNTTNTSGTN